MATTHRLSVNINEESAAILRSVTKDRGITTTEAIRRAIGLLGFFEQALQNDTTLIAEDASGNQRVVSLI